MKWIFLPKIEKIPNHLVDVVKIFEKYSKIIDSSKDEHSKNSRNSSDQILKIIQNDLVKLGYSVEKGKKKTDKIRIPVLYGENGKEELAFEADAYFQEHKTVIEVEGGRATRNYQFLKNIFQASMMVDTDYLVLAVRLIYSGGNTKSKDFQISKDFIDSIFLTNKIKLDLKGILLIGY